MFELENNETKQQWIPDNLRPIVNKKKSAYNCVLKIKVNSQERLWKSGNKFLIKKFLHQCAYKGV